jgi:hypothetical protein
VACADRRASLAWEACFHGQAAARALQLLDANQGREGHEGPPSELSAVMAVCLEAFVGQHRDRIDALREARAQALAQAQAAAAHTGIRPRGQT